MSHSNPIKFSASILAADFSNLAQAVREAEKGGSASIHIDIMDGHYVRNFTFGPDLIPALRPHTSLPLIVHLEIDNPDEFISVFAGAGTDAVVVCEDTCSNLAASIAAMRAAGLEVGVSLNPDRPLSLIKPYLAQIDHLILLAVLPGFGGQKFDPSVLQKIREARILFNQLSKPPTLGVDGGINRQTIAAAVDAGADTLIAGTAIFQHGTVRKNILNLRRLIDNNMA